MNRDLLTTVTTALRHGAIVVVRTDTIYGIIALAGNERAVTKVYNAKGRDTSKPSIVLVASPNDVPRYAATLRAYSEDAAIPTSVVVPASTEPQWITRGGDSVAYRVVKDSFLQRIIRDAGPVIAPSANPEGKPPATNIDEAKAYFGDGVDVYIDGGQVLRSTRASRIISIDAHGAAVVVRDNN